MRLQWLTCVITLMLFWAVHAVVDSAVSEDEIPWCTQRVQCTGGNKLNIPNPDNCSLYFYCTGNAYHIRFCPTDTLFDNITHDCRYALNQSVSCAAPCGENPNSTVSTVRAASTTVTSRTSSATLSTTSTKTSSSTSSSTSTRVPTAVTLTTNFLTLPISQPATTSTMTSSTTVLLSSAIPTTPATPTSPLPPTFGTSPIVSAVPSPTVPSTTQSVGETSTVSVPTSPLIGSPSTPTTATTSYMQPPTSPTLPSTTVPTSPLISSSSTPTTATTSFMQPPTSSTLTSTIVPTDAESSSTSTGTSVQSPLASSLASSSLKSTSLLSVSDSSSLSTSTSTVSPSSSSSSSSSTVPVTSTSTATSSSTVTTTITSTSESPTLTTEIIVPLPSSTTLTSSTSTATESSSSMTQSSTTLSSFSTSSLPTSTTSSTLASTTMTIHDTTSLSTSSTANTVSSSSFPISSTTVSMSSSSLSSATQSTSPTPSTSHELSSTTTAQTTASSTSLSVTHTLTASQTTVGDVSTTDQFTTSSTQTSTTGDASTLPPLNSPSTSTSFLVSSSLSPSPSTSVVTSSTGVTSSSVPPTTERPVVHLVALSGRRVAESTKTLFLCTVTANFVHVESITWYINGQLMTSLTSRRISFTNSTQLDGQGNVNSTLTIDPTCFTDAGTVKCEATYGGLFFNFDELKYDVIPRPRVAVTPAVLTSQPNVTQSVTCAATFPSVMNSTQQFANVTWLVKGQPIGIIGDGPVIGDHTEYLTPGGLGVLSVLTVKVLRSTDVTCRWTNVAQAAVFDEQTSSIHVITANDVMCPTDYRKDVNWEQTIAGYEDVRPCPRGTVGKATRRCVFGSLGAAGVWEEPDLDWCIPEGLNDQDIAVTKMEQTLNPVNSSQLTNVSMAMANLTGGSKGGLDTPLSPAAINKTVDLSQRVAQLHREKDVHMEKDELEAMTQTISNVLDDTHANSWNKLQAMEMVDDAGPKLMMTINDLSDIWIRQMQLDGRNQTVVFNAQDYEPAMLTKQNLVVQIGAKSNQTRFPQWMNNSAAEAAAWTQFTDDYIDVPTAVLDRINYNGRAVITSSSCAKNLYRYVTGQPLLSNVSNTTYLNSPILSLAIPGIQKIFQPPITVTLRHFKNINVTSERGMCVFWNVSSANWSSENCTLVTSNATHTICQCEHLTNFAVLVSPYVPTGAIALALSIISMIGVIVSNVCLFLTVVFYAIRWKVRKSHRAAVLINLCLALFTANIIFVAGIDKMKPEAGCTAIAALLHYFYLAAFFIMLVEGVQLSLYVFAVFHVHRKRDTAAMIFTAWFLPVIIVGASLGITKLVGYGSDKQCWLSVETGLLWAFVGPALFIILVNIIIVVLVLKRISSVGLRVGAQPNKKSKVKSLLRNILVILPVLGITWVFGVIAVNKDLVVFQFIFAIANGFQGVFIFVFHALCHGKGMGGGFSKKKSSSSQQSSRSKTAASRQQNGHNKQRQLTRLQDRERCISRHHMPYDSTDDVRSSSGSNGSSGFILATKHEEAGWTNPGYDGTEMPNNVHIPLSVTVSATSSGAVSSDGGSSGNGPSLASPAMRELPIREEVAQPVTDVLADGGSVGVAAGVPIRPRRRVAGGPPVPTRPPLSRFLSSMSAQSDASDATTSTYVSAGSDMSASSSRTLVNECIVEYDERL